MVIKTQQLEQLGQEVQQRQVLEVCTVGSKHNCAKLVIAVLF